jgi:tyrosinase
MGPGPRTDFNPHCLRRDFAPAFAVSKCNLSEAMWPQSAETFAEFDERVQGGVSIADMTYHPGAHFGVGGELGEVHPPSDINSRLSNNVLTSLPDRKPVLIAG